MFTRSTGPVATLDLHLHTTVSDGAWTPTTLVERIATLDIDLIAVADHDALDSVALTTTLAAARGIRVVSGVEVTTRWDGRQWHLLVYGAPLDDGPVQRLVRRQRDEHIDRAEEAIRRLAGAGYDLPSLPAIVAGRPPLPIYVMQALVRDGLATTILEANQFITDRLGVPFYIDLPLAEAIEAAHTDRAVTILAHPGRDEGAGILTADRLAWMLADVPLDGLEVYYPTHSAAQVAEYATLVDHYQLLHSCGSDSHGPGLPRDPLPYPAHLVAPLLERLGYLPATEPPRR